jgi:hypothetical protein
MADSDSDSWQQAADAIARAEKLIADIPRLDGYELAPDTDLELRGAAVLVQRAVLYLRTAVSREAPRLEAVVAEFEARGELPPWDRGARAVAEDGD